MLLKLVHPDCIQHLQGFEGDWVYADENLDEYQTVVAIMGGESRRLLTPEAFQQTVGDLQTPFVQWVDDCMAEQAPRDWLTTPLRKNPFDSHLFLHLAWLVVLEPAFSRSGKDVAVVTRSLGLVRTLEQLCRERLLACQCHGKARLFFGKAAADAMAFLKWGGKILSLLCRVVLARVILGKRYVTAKLSTTELLVESYLHEGDLNVCGEFSDRYFPGLLAFYREQGVKVTCFPFLYRIPLLRCGTTYSRMKNSATPFAPFELFLKIRDVLYAAGASLASSATVFPVKAFCGLKVDGLVDAERFSAALGGLIPLALSCTPRRMAEDGMAPNWFVDWFENQPLDKGINLGLQEAMPSCRTIAARLYIPSRNMLSLFTSPGEVLAKLAPTENWVCGNALKAVVALYGAHGEYRVMPALRYSYLYGELPKAGDADALLILLSHSLEESLGIMDCAAAALSKAAEWRVRVVVKPHPDLNIGLLRRKFFDRFPSLQAERIEWTAKKLAELLPAARVVVTSGSGSAVEAVCRGVPIVLVGRLAGLDYNPLEWVDKRMWESVYASEQLVAAVCRRLSATVGAREKLRQLAEDIKLDFFLEASDENMRRFLPDRQAA